MQRNRLKYLSVVVLLLGFANAGAAPREAGKNDAALLKLQATVKAITAERDATKAEVGKLTADIEQLRKERDSAQASKDDLNGSLAAQRQSSQELSTRLEKTNAKLIETVEKTKELSQVKTNLSQELFSLKAKQQGTEQQLQICGQHNGQLVQAAQELLERYENKGVMASLLQDEPLLQFKRVDMEEVAQRYVDEINAGKYRSPTEELPLAK